MSMIGLSLVPTVALGLAQSPVVEMGPQLPPSWNAQPEDTAPVDDDDLDSLLDEPTDESDLDDEDFDTEAEAEADPAEATPAPAPGLKVPEKKGLGLIITAGALGAVGWSVMGARMGIVRKGCRNDTDLTTVESSDIDALLVSGGSCLGARATTVLLWFMQAGPNSANWGLAPAAGAVRAKYDAARSVLEDGPDRKPMVFVGAGAGLLAGGVIGRTVVAAIRWRGLRNPAEGYVGACFADDGSTTPEEFFDCYAGRNMGQFFGQQITSASIAAGAGLLTYGLVYKKTRANYERSQGTGKTVEQARLQLSITPQLSLHHTGVSATLRF